MSNLPERIAELEQMITDLECRNRSLAQRHVGAPDATAHFCERHITLNSESIRMAREALVFLRGRHLEADTPHATAAAAGAGERTG